MQRPKSWSFPKTKEDLSAFTNVLRKKNSHNELLRYSYFYHPEGVSKCTDRFETRTSPQETLGHLKGSTSSKGRGGGAHFLL